MTRPLFEMRHVSVSYQEKRTVDDVSFELEKGKILGIVGESGSGKSTIVKAAMGILGREGSVEEGEIYLEGRNILELSGEELRKLQGEKMSMIFQNPGASLCPIRTIGDQFYETMRCHGRTDRSTCRQEILELFQKLNLRDGERILRSYPFELSGGMSQRVGIALAMILKPSVLFADEPTSALDVTVQAQAVREMMNMRDLFGTAIVIVSHNMGLISYMADEILVMYGGKAVERGSAREIVLNPRNAYTKHLIQSVPRLKRKGKA